VFRVLIRVTPTFHPADYRTLDLWRQSDLYSGFMVVLVREPLQLLLAIAAVQSIIQLDNKNSKTTFLS